MQTDQPNQNDQWQAPQNTVPSAPYQPIQPVEDADLTPDQTNQQTPAIDQKPQTETTIDDSVAEKYDESEILARWQGTEYIDHDHSIRWYAIFGVIVIVLMLISIFLIKSLSFTILIPIMALTLFVYIRRAPAINNYSLSRTGLHINDKLFPYENFKSFSVITQTGHNSIVLVPRKRFQIAQTIYFPSEVGESIVDMLAARLPMVNGELDAIDKFLAKIRL